MSAPERKYKADPGIGRDEAPIGSESWAQSVRLHLQVMVKDVDSEPKRIRRYIDLIVEHRAWTLMNKPDGSYFRTFEELCEHPQPWGLGKPWAKIKLHLVAAHDGNEAAVAALTTRPEAAPKAGGKREGAGRPAHDEPRAVTNHRSDTYADSSLTQKRDSTYLAARIARDAPAVHEDMKAGKFPSVRAAAKAAGIVKDPDPVTVASRAVTRVPANRLAELVARFDDALCNHLRVCLGNRS